MIRKSVSKKGIIASMVVDGVLVAGNTACCIYSVVNHKNIKPENQFVFGMIAGVNLAATVTDTALLCCDTKRLIEYNKAEKAAKNSEAVETK